MSRPVLGNPAVDVEVKNAFEVFKSCLFNKDGGVRRDKLRNLDEKLLREIQLATGMLETQSAYFVSIRQSQRSGGIKGNRK